MLAVAVKGKAILRRLMRCKAAYTDKRSLSVKFAPTVCTGSGGTSDTGFPNRMLGSDYGAKYGRTSRRAM